MCIFDYDTPQGEVRAFYQVLTTTSYGGGFYESFMGTEASIKISEIASTSAIYRESGDTCPTGTIWWTRATSSASPRRPSRSRPPMRWPPTNPPHRKSSTCPADSANPPTSRTSRTSSTAVRGKAKLNCDARHAFESEAPIFWVNPSALSKQPIDFTSEHLSV